MTQQPTTDEKSTFGIRSLLGVDVGLGADDPRAAIAGKLAAQYPHHLVLVQAGGFLHGFDRTAYALHALKRYKLKLVGTAAAPHLRVGFPAGNFKRRLWPVVAEFGIPYVVALGTVGREHTIHVSAAGDSNAGVLAAVSDQVVSEAIADLRRQAKLNEAAARELLAHPDTAGFHLKTRAQDLELVLMRDIVKMPRDLRTTFGENLRCCLARILRAVMAYGLEENKPALLREISADVDVLKHYLTQAPRLSRLDFQFEHRVGLAVELGRLVGGLLRAQQVQS